MSARGRGVAARYRHVKWVLSLWLIEARGGLRPWAWHEARLARRRSLAYRARYVRRLAAEVFAGVPCWFCETPLLEASDHKAVWWIRVAITIHHLNGDHDDDRPENHRPAHAKCHKAHHVRARKAAMRAAA